MSYTSEFKETIDFQVLCKPFLHKLPKAPSDVPLQVVYSLKATGKARWQWYNFLKHKAPNSYKISVKSNPINPSENIFIISRKLSIQDEVHAYIRTPSGGEIATMPQEDFITATYGLPGTPERDKFEEAKKKLFPEKKPMTFDDL